MELDLELLSKELIENAKESMQKRLQYFDDAFSKLKKGNKESLEAIKLIDKAYSEEVKNEKMAYNAFLSKMDELDATLKNTLNTYSENVNFDKEEEKLGLNKEKAMQPKTLIYRKEIHDANFKYDRILKEEKEVLKEKQEKLDEYEKQFRLKIIDLEKRLRLELNKEKSKATELTEEYQKNLLEVNNRREIKALNKKIEEIQRLRIKEEKKIKLNYVDLIRGEKLNFEENKKALLEDREDAAKEFKLKKLEVEKEKKQINLRYEIEKDKYDFGSERAINNLNLKMNLKKNSLILSFKENKMNEAIKLKSETLDRINHRESIVCDFSEVLNKGYRAFVDTLKNERVVMSDVYFKGLNDYNTYFEKVVSSLKEMVLEIFKEYYDNIVNREYESLKLILNAKYSLDVYNKKPSENFLNKLNDIYSNFKNSALQNEKRVEEEIILIFDETCKSMKKVFVLLKEEFEKTDFDKYQNELLDALVEEVNNLNEYEKEYFEKEKDDFAYVDEKTKEYEDYKASSIIENENLNKLRDTKDKEINDSLSSKLLSREEENKKIEEEYKDAYDKINSNFKSSLDEYLNNYNLEVEKINLEKESSIKKIESDFSEAMNLFK